MEHHYQLPPFREKSPKKTHKKGRKSIVELKGSEEKRVHRGRASGQSTPGGETLWSVLGTQEYETITSSFLGSVLYSAFQKDCEKGLIFSIPPLRLMTHHTTYVHSENLYSQMSQELYVQITFKEENINFTHTEKHTELCMSVWRSWNRLHNCCASNHNHRMSFSTHKLRIHSKQHCKVLMSQTAIPELLHSELPWTLVEWTQGWLGWGWSGSILSSLLPELPHCTFPRQEEARARKASHLWHSRLNLDFTCLGHRSVLLTCEEWYQADVYFYFL